MFQSHKPYSAVTVQVEVLTSEQYEEDDPAGIVDLIEVIRIQASGPTEASRALRKKLKYGNLHRQLRALTILDFLIQNAGDRFLREFADEPLLERLRIAATDSVSDPLVKRKCQQLFGQWAVSYKDKRGMEKIGALYQQLPKRKQPANQAKAKVLREGASTNNDQPLGHRVSVSTGSGPTKELASPKQKSSNKPKKDKKERRLTQTGTFNLEKERPEIVQTLASVAVASTNLLNSLKLVNRETTRVSEDAECISRFDKCKHLRRQILRYIQHIESEEFLGGLIHANDELVNALMAFEVLDKSVDYDSDSDDESMHAYLKHQWGHEDDKVNQSLSGLSVNPPKPPRPNQPTASSSQHPSKELQSESDSEVEDDDENNPFGDRNAIKTPAVEKSGYSWKEV